MCALRVALALGSGGARGYAHIGVLDVLAERGFTVAAIAGSSMGSLIGGLAAAGQLEHYTEWVRTLNQREVIKLLDPVLPGGPGAFRAERIISRLGEFLGGVQIEDLPIPFTAVATDVVGRREVWFQQGPLVTAIRASIAMPSVITPIIVNGRLLMDGGVLNPVPVDPMTPIPRDLTIAVSLMGTAQPSSAIGESAEPRPPAEWLDRLRRGLLDNDLVRPILERFAAESGGSAAEPPPYEQASGMNILDVTMLAVDTMGALIERYRMAGNPPDIVIRIPREACGTLDFHRAAEVIEIGREAAAAAVDAYLAEHPDALPARQLPAAMSGVGDAAEQRQIIGW